MLSCVKVSAVVKVPQMYPTTVSACELLLALLDATATMNRSEAAFHNEPLMMHVACDHDMHSSCNDCKQHCHMITVIIFSSVQQAGIQACTVSLPAYRDLL